ncbi:hypothetical protein ID849_16780 [Xenorhabdus sp. 3]|nr:hypothetical protein [Xenorhabdus sp. 3]
MTVTKIIGPHQYKQRKDRWSVGHRPITEIKPPGLVEILSRMEKWCATEKLKKVRQCVISTFLLIG